LGRHCEAENCNQKDFLPFHCGSCGKSLCLAHRTFTNHQCAGERSRDMTSMDCPVCGKSVKFDKSQDPNIVWDVHNATECSQIPKAAGHEVKRCFSPNCHKVLGPSNTFSCRKCHQNVCLTHRMPEAHSCVGNIRQSFLDQFQSPSSSKGKGQHSSQEKDKNKVSPSMFLPHPKKHEKEPAVRPNPFASLFPSPPPPPPPPRTAAAAAGLVCPFCSLAHEDDASLLGHILAFHPEEAQAASEGPGPVGVGGGDQFFPPPPPPSSSSAHGHSSSNNSHGHSRSSSSNEALYREVCPVCQARCPDAIALVRHFEAKHSAQAQAAAGGGGGGGRGNNSSTGSSSGGSSGGNADGSGNCAMS
jgi:predicted nucleic acid binding AN1-type Zn finger protein